MGPGGGVAWGDVPLKRTEPILRHAGRTIYFPIDPLHLTGRALVRSVSVATEKSGQLGFAGVTHLSSIFRTKSRIRQN